MELKDVLEDVGDVEELVPVTLQKLILVAEAASPLVLMQYVKEVVEVRLHVLVEVTALEDVLAVLAALETVKVHLHAPAEATAPEDVLVVLAVLADATDALAAQVDVMDVLVVLADVEGAEVPARIIVGAVVMAVVLAVLALALVVVVVVEVVALATVTLDVHQLRNKMHIIPYQTFQQLFMLVK